MFSNNITIIYPKGRKSVDENDYVAGYLQAQNEGLYKSKVETIWSRATQLILAAALGCLILFYGTGQWLIPTLIWCGALVTILLLAMRKIRAYLRTYDEVRAQMPLRGSVSTAAAQDSTQPPEGPQKGALEYAGTVAEATIADGICAVCGGAIERIESTAWNGAENDVLDSWWAHVDHPEDGHDAVPMKMERPRSDVLDEKYDRVKPNPECSTCHGHGQVESTTDDVTSVEPCEECVIPFLTGPDWIAVTDFGSKVTSFYPIGSEITLGEIANVLQELKKVGVTWQSLEYAMKRVWGKEIEEEERMMAEVRRAFEKRAEQREAELQEISEGGTRFVTWSEDGIEPLNFTPQNDDSEEKK